MKLLEKNLIIPKTQGKNTIPKAKGFDYIDKDFISWKANEPSKNTKPIKVNVFELDEDMTFSEIFTDPEQQCLTQSQIIAFIENHKDKLRTNGYATFFLFKSYGKFFVAYAFFDVSGRLELRVRRLSHDFVWFASYQHRVVTPSLKITKKHIPTYDSWRKIIDRCDNKKSKNYSNYGGRGISYCEKWKTFEGFLEDMGEKPKEKSIDRIDVNGNYCKENCRWATPKEQASNRRDNIIFKGETAKEASKRLGGGNNLVQQRIKDCGWTIEDAFTFLAKELGNKNPATNSKTLDTNSLDSLSRIVKLEEDMDKIKKFLIKRT